MRGRMATLVVAGLLIALVVGTGPNALAAFASTFASNVRVNPLNDPDQVNPAVAVGYDGSVSVVWEDYLTGKEDPDVWFARSDDGANTFTTFASVTGNTGIGTVQQYPSVAISPGCELGPCIHVVFTHLQGAGTLVDGIYYVKSVDGGASFGSWTRLSAPSQLWSEFGRYVSAQIVYDGFGQSCRLHVVWSTFDLLAGGVDFGVWYVRSDDCGVTWGPPELIVSASHPPPVIQYAYEAAIDVASDGAVAVAFAAGTGDVTDVFYIWAYRPLYSWSPWAKANSVTGYYGARNPTIAYEATGEPGEHLAHLAWEDSRNMDPGIPASFYDWDIYYTNMAGVVSGGNVLVNDRICLGLYCEQSDPSIGLDGMHNPKIAWTDWRNDLEGQRTPTGVQDVDVAYAESTTGGSTFGPNVRVNNDATTREQCRPALATFQGVEITGVCTLNARPMEGVYIAWHDERDAPTDFNVYITPSASPPTTITSAVDIAGVGQGDDQRIAVAWGSTKVSLFSRVNGASGPLHTEDMGFVVDFVVLSEDGAYLAVLGNERPFTDVSRAFVRLFGPIIDPTLLWPPIYAVDLPHTAHYYGRPFDMTRDGGLVAVGTGIASWSPIYPVGDVYLIETPPVPGTPAMTSYAWGRRALSLRFTGDGTRLAVGSTDGAGGVPQGVLAVSSSPPTLSLVWSSGVPNDSAYSVAMDFDGTLSADGHGNQHFTYTRDAMGATSLPWPASEAVGDGEVNGVTHSLSLSWSGSYLFAGESWDARTGNVPSFVLWNTGTTAYLWRYSPTPARGYTRVDSGVATSAQFLVGGLRDHVYFWGAAYGPAPGPSPRTDFALEDGACFVDLAMTFNGRYTAVVDDLGRLHVYASTDTADSIPWPSPGYYQL